MTIHDVIAEVDKLKPNMFDEKDKIKWLSRLEQRIYQDIILTHEYNTGEEEIVFNGYTEDDGEQELIVGEPHDEMYILWLAAQIDYYNMEYDSFNSSNAMFDSVFRSFRNAYNQSHMPKGTRKIFY
ncbi:MAG: hypothetical protein J5449_08305 [Oscillospiraceae bacterium]|nr:hypothetical protein [Oscillospiraceae bacterium]